LKIGNSELSCDMSFVVGLLFLPETKDVDITK